MKQNFANARGIKKFSIISRYAFGKYIRETVSGDRRHSTQGMKTRYHSLLLCIEDIALPGRRFGDEGVQAILHQLFLQ